MIKKGFLSYPLLILSIIFVFASSCKKEKDDNEIQYYIPTLSTKEVTEITHLAASTGGNITGYGGKAVTMRGVCWSTSETPTIEDNKTEDGSGNGSFISNLTNLEPETKYYVRAYATNSIGTGYGNVMSFTTKIAHTLGSFTDVRDGNVYKTVTIGNQVWMAENLKYLPSINTVETVSETNPCYYVYGYSGTNVDDAKATVNYSTFGVLYNYKAAEAACPAGWHLPTKDEWNELINILGGADFAGGKLKETGTAHWSSPNSGANNEIGFTALPGGGYFLGSFKNIGMLGLFWTSTQYFNNNELKFIVNPSYNSQGIYIDGLSCVIYNGISVRCVKD